jgi:hypothetical protein
MLPQEHQHTATDLKHQSGPYKFPRTGGFVQPYSSCALPATHGRRGDGEAPIPAGDYPLRLPGSTTTE